MTAERAGPGEKIAESQELTAIATRFTHARRAGAALPDYPGAIPADLSAAYAIQEIAIGQWGEPIIGWKIGRIQDPELQRLHQQERLAGPIFAGGLHGAGGTFPIFRGGFAAVEAEFVLELAHDAEPKRTEWSLEDAKAIAGRMFCGIETAGSPLRTINDLGPTVVASDFGNNAGLILGSEIADWRAQPFEALTCTTDIDGATVGTGTAASVPEGPVAALRFLLEHCARRGRPLRKGQYASTGAATGIHLIAPEQSARVDFGRYGVIEVRAVAAA